MKIFEGIVISTGMNNTVSVSVERKVPHPLYRKLIKKNRNYLVDSTGFELNVGEKVKIIETKPISKNKFFKVMEMAGKTSTKKVEVKENKKIDKEAVKVKEVKTPKKKAVRPAPAKAKSGKKEAK